jgi:hypothetical protein
MAALVAAFAVEAKTIVVYHVLDKNTAHAVGVWNLPLVGDLQEFEDMSDCALWIRWDAKRGAPFIIKQNERKYDHGILSCVGLEGAVHTAEVEILPATDIHDGGGI